MQGVVSPDVTQLISLEVALVFVVLLFWGFFKYARIGELRDWAIGWILIAFMSGPVLIWLSEDTSPYDVLSVSGIVIGCTFLLRGSIADKREISVAKHIVPIAVLSLVYSWTSVQLSLHWSMTYAPVHLYSSLVLLLFLRRLKNLQIATGFVPHLLTAAVVAWIAAGLLFPLAWLGIGNVLVTYVGIEATAVSVLGASLFILLLRESHRTAEQHHKVSLLMASVVQHDIRNFLQTAISALEMATDNDKQASLWIAAAIDSLVRAADFVKEMRDISAEIMRFERVEMPVDLASMIKTVVDTLKHIYVERPRTVQIQVPHPFLVISNQLLKQVLWNIIDNSFKHGSDTLTIWSNVSGSRGTLLIEDRAGGVDEEIRRYVNNLSVSEDQMPGVGLGVILIRGLSQLAHARVTLQNVTDESVVVGCRYALDFRLAESV